jgi:hypothetical protein
MAWGASAAARSTAAEAGAELSGHRHIWSPSYTPRDSHVSPHDPREAWHVANRFTLSHTARRRDVVVVVLDRSRSPSTYMYRERGPRRIFWGWFDRDYTQIVYPVLLVFSYSTCGSLTPAPESFCLLARPEAAGATALRSARSVVGRVSLSGSGVALGRDAKSEDTTRVPANCLHPFSGCGGKL